MSGADEIDGTPLLMRRLTASALGDTTLISVPVGSVLRIKYAFLSVNSDITGEVVLKINTTEIGGIKNPKSGGQYVLCTSKVDYGRGADGEDLVVNLPAAIAVTVNVGYKIIAS